MSLRKIVVEDYNPEWAEEFQILKGIYQDKLGDLAVDIQHVGSTSVPGLAAKPVLDIDIIIDDQEKLQPVIEKLAELGYSHLGNLGIEGREAFKRTGTSVECNFSHNLYVCILGAASLENHLRFRDYLLVDPYAVEEYGRLKKELATKFPNDIDSYVDGKTEFITKVLALVGMDRKSIEDIDKANRKAE